MEIIVKSALDSMSTVKKHQKTFIFQLLFALIVVQGKATFLNMSRYSSMSEKRFRRWYRRAFDFFMLNWLMLSGVLSNTTEKIAALDASFMTKSGNKTDGLGKFWRGCTSRSERGLELSLLGVVDLKSNTAYALGAKQTIDEDNKSRVELYAEQVVSLAKTLLQQGIQYLAVDAYYFKERFVTAVAETGLHIVGKLRNDADLKWLYEGSYSGRGRPKIYDGKVNLEKDLKRFQFIGQLETGESVYTAVVHSKCLGCKIRVVMLRIQRGDKMGVSLLYSTDSELDAMTIIRYYRARFQIEFVFRDAKQYTGLMDCQSCSKDAIHTQINASFAALNLLKLADREKKDTEDKTVISIASWKRRLSNQNLMHRVFEKLGLAMNDEKVMNTYEELSSYGAIAA
ncbi:transposase [Endozoicomonas atrinae]|uniref:transposase n=1 Tax=Endozoicomonas atrinae TaxID=1333660 RepID=UPI0008255463|nr:transposase [Endozoicomonas atrinae]